MNILYLDLLPAYIPFEKQAVKADGTVTSPTGTPTVSIFEEDGADATFSATEITGSPFTCAVINATTGNFGVLVAKSLLTAGKIYRCLYEWTVDSIATAAEDNYFALNSSSFKADVSSLALEATLTDIKGTSFATGTDSLKILSDNIDTINGKADTISTAVVTTIPTTLTAIEGSGFATGTDSLKILSDNLDTVNGKADTISTAVVTTIPTAIAGVPALVWGVTARTLTSFGTLVADIATAVWGAIIRTLTAGTKDAEIDAIVAKLPTTTIASEAQATINTNAILAKDADLRTTS